MNSPLQLDYKPVPFPHVTTGLMFGADLCDLTLDWFEREAPWRLKIASFYEQWELHLDRTVLPGHLLSLIDGDALARVQDLLKPITPSALELVEVTAHKLLAGQTIRIHNDFIPRQETHRVLLQLNRGWAEAQGGILMLFGSADATDLRRALRPIHRSGFAFEISPQSFHAVSTIASGERFTVVYSFREPRFADTKR
jgi:Rps23 Pro-64 3,4-dihydroxylase Tpa1-like proline 4-hydroxylase